MNQPPTTIWHRLLSLTGLDFAAFGHTEVEDRAAASDSIANAGTGNAPAQAALPALRDSGVRRLSDASVVGIGWVTPKAEINSEAGPVQPAGPNRQVVSARAADRATTNPDRRTKTLDVGPLVRAPAADKAVANPTRRAKMAVAGPPVETPAGAAGARAHSTGTLDVRPMDALSADSATTTPKRKTQTLDLGAVARPTDGSTSTVAPDLEPARPTVRTLLLRGARLAAEGALVASIALACAWLLWPRLGLGVQEDAKLDAGHARFDEMAAAYNAKPIDFEGTEGTRVLAAAVVYAEDRGFRDRPTWLPPVSPRGLTRAVIANVRGRRIGGSTIPQQLAKLMVREDSSGVYDKWRELVFATELTRRHDPETILGVYINLALSLRERDPVGGARTASLALRGRPLTNISREDAVLLAVLPRGWSKMKRKPAVATARIRGVRDGLAATGAWDESRVSWLDDEALDTTEELGLWPGWHALVDGGPDALDEAAALASAQDAIDDEVKKLEERGVPSVGGVLVAFLDTPKAPGTTRGAAGQSPSASHRGPTVVASAPWLDVALLNLASGSKIELLDLVVDSLGESSAYELTASHSRPIRWWWREGGGPRDGRRPGLLRPRDAIKPHKLAPYGPKLSLADTVLLSVNSSAMSHLVNRVPYALYIADPAGYVERATELVPEAPLLATDTERRVASNRLRELGVDLPPERIPDTLTGQAAPLYVLRLLAQRRAAKGVTVRRKLPEDPTSLLGNSSSESGTHIATYLGEVLLAPSGCRLTPTGRVLATGFDRGTLGGASRALGDEFGRAAGKTGSSPRDDTIWMAMTVCIDHRPAVVLASLRTLDDARLPDRFYAGPTLTPAIVTFIRDLQTRGHHVVGPMASPETVLEEMEAAAGPLPKETMR